MLSAICFNLDQSKILSSGNGLRSQRQKITALIATNVIRVHKICSQFIEILWNKSPTLHDHRKIF